MLQTNLFIEQLDSELKPIVIKIINEERITEEEGINLYTKAPITLLGSLANAIREKKKWKLYLL
tara:strand:+ start:139 stop:330 length:192 start_codon:yes stop_codon:yes gene_type:complete